MKAMNFSYSFIIVYYYLSIIHFRVGKTSQYLVKCNREKNKCLNDISNKGFIAKETNVPDFYSVEDPNVSLNITDDTLENGTLEEETEGYGYGGNIKFANVKSKSKAKLKVIEGVDLVEEQIYEKRVKKTRDANWMDMWAVNGLLVPSMKIIEAWNLGYSGSGIYIAVIDDGVDIFHRDLRVNMGSSYHYDYVSNDRDPTPIRSDTHGTNCAGLVAAGKDNNECIVGIAYNAGLVGIRLINVLGTSDLMEGNALSHEQSTIDIYTNSWGPEDGLGFGSMRTLTSAAVEKGIRTGRNGKGTIYVWAAGNGGLHDNCNADAYVNSIYTISISSINSNGLSATYAEVCTPVLAVTYGGGGGTNKYLYSTSRLNSCTGKHAGTSFSAPHAAAIIALTLEANPALTWRDVQHIIVRTSKKHYLWDGTYKWQINGANISVHPVLGFGLMDAEAMVKMAKSWKSVPVQRKYTTSTLYPHSYIHTWNINTGVTEYMTIDKCDTNVRFLEHVVVWVDFESDSNGDAELRLTSPSGTTSYLLTSRPLEVGNALSVRWSYMTVQHWGESPIGMWKLKMLVSSSLYTGTLHSWKITFYGTLNELSDPIYGNRSNTSNCPQSNVATTAVYSKDSAPNLSRMEGIIAGSVCGGILLLFLTTA